MNSIKRINNFDNGTGNGAVTPRYHLSDTLDWSCFSARIKSRMFIVPMYTKIYSNTEIPKDDTVGNAARNSDDK